MNKIVNINLGGLPFTIDEDAFAQLENYISQLKDHFKDSEGCDEIVGDIESRIAELFQENLADKNIVTVKEVQLAIKIMGKPSDFGAVDEEDVYSDFESDTTQNKKFSFKTGKKLYRNPDDVVISGVCSGIAAYFGIREALWVRLLFVIGGLASFGTVAILYGALYGLLPEANTSAEKLEMRGEPINVSSIAKNIEEEMRNFQDQFRTESKKFQFGSKKKRKAKESEEWFSESSENDYSRGHPFRRLVKLIGIVLTIVLIFILIATWMGIGGTFIFSFNLLTKFLFSSTMMAILSFISILGVISVPIIGLTATSVKLISGRGLSPNWRAFMSIFFAFSFIGLIVNGTYLVKSFSTSGITKSKIPFSGISGDTLKLEIDQKLAWKNVDDIMGFDIYNESVVSNYYDLIIAKAEGDQFEFAIEKMSRGGNKSDAEELANEINFSYSFHENVLKLSNYFDIGENKRWRGQWIKVIVYVPEGKSITLTKGLERLLEQPYQVGSDASSSEMTNNTWTMLSDGLACISCKGLPSFGLTQNFNAVLLKGNFSGRIVRGDQFKVSYNYKEKDISLKREGGLLLLENQSRKKEHFRITVPNLNEITLKNNSKIYVTGFEQAAMDIHLENVQKLQFDGEVNSLKLKAISSNLYFNGEGNFIDLDLKNNTRFRGSRFLVRKGNVSVDSESKAEVNIDQEIFLQATDEDNVSNSETAKSTDQKIVWTPESLE